MGQRNWVFYGDVTGKQGARQAIQLMYATQVPIKRHTKIQAAANPYDPAWETYFEKRLEREMMATLRGQRQVLSLWKRQNGMCPICQQKITQQTGWDNHHRVARVDGGGDGAENRVLLHPNCHRQVHSHELTVAKPRPATGE